MNKVIARGLTLLLAAGCAALAAPRCAGQPAPAVAQPESDGQVLAIPPGVTMLEEAGLYRVWWQSYGKPAVQMPVGWAGPATADTGIMFQPGLTIHGRGAILIHSPWRVPAGRTWVDYPLELPRLSPLRFSFAIAMGPNSVGPARGDGVTFSCTVLDAEGEHELLRRHYAVERWTDYDFDLARWAGQRITLRLQVEPGPARNASFDFSYFGDARITAGPAQPDRAGQIDRLMATPARRALDKAPLTALSNDPTSGVLPSSLLPHRNQIQGEGADTLFTYEGEDGRVVYRYRPATGMLDDFTVQLDGGAPFKPAPGGGATARLMRAGKAVPLPLRGGRPVSAQLTPDGQGLGVLWEYPLGEGSVRVAWRFGIRGKALAVEATCDQPVIESFSLGQEPILPLRRTIAVPYLLGNFYYFPTQDRYCGRYLDWSHSNASRCEQGEAAYEPRTDGTLNPLHEAGYIAVSPELGEVLPNIPNPVSPWIGQLAPRVMLDVWGHTPGGFRGDAAHLRDLKDNGVDHLAIIDHDWQCYGYDVKLPDHLPAASRLGGDAGMAEFGRAANDCGYLWSLHENYIDLYPDAPSYDPGARVLQADGLPSLAWFNPGTRVQSFGLKTNRALDFARKNTPEIHRRFGTTAGYLDVHSSVVPWHQLDHEAGQPMAAMELGKFLCDSKLFQFMRDTHGGPIFGEGHWQFFWAGRCDGVEAQVDGGAGHRPLLDFDLLKIHPQMVNHGMGYYERFFKEENKWQQGGGTVEKLDQYRAQEVAYGHAGFIGAALTGDTQWVAREHNMVYPVQRLACAARPAQISYEVENRFVPAGVALAVGELGRSRVRYENGLTVWVNQRPEPWTVEGRTLPQWGWLAQAPPTAGGPRTMAGTWLHDGRLADSAECPEFAFADARTAISFPWNRPPRRIEPRLGRFEDLGGGRVRLAYEWQVRDRLPGDYGCFVHFMGDPNGPILFQGDHGLPKPVAQWRMGETVADGPYELTIPEGTATSYDLVIGLFEHSGNQGRVPLEGINYGQDRILLGRLKVERDGRRVRGVRLVAAAEVARERGLAATPAAPDPRLNPPGTRIDFGTIATDGAVKVNRAARALTVFPYPRDRDISVTLTVAALATAPAGDLAKLRVRALAAGDGRDLGLVEHTLQDGRVTFRVGKPGAGRYLVEW